MWTGRGQSRRLPVLEGWKEGFDGRWWKVQQDVDRGQGGRSRSVEFLCDSDLKSSNTTRTAHNETTGCVEQRSACLKSNSSSVEGSYTPQYHFYTSHCTHLHTEDTLISIHNICTQSLMNWHCFTVTCWESDIKPTWKYEFMDSCSYVWSAIIHYSNSVTHTQIYI